MQTLLQDLRYALRMLRKNPGFTAAAILTLALGIGANTAIFTVVNAVLLKPLPYPDPDRIVQFVYGEKGCSNSGQCIGGASIPEFVAWREQAQALQDFTMYDAEGALSGGGTEFYFVGPGINLTGSDRPERLTSIHVSSSYFRLFGAPMEIGRAFTAQEDIPRGPKVVVISDGFWRRRLGADRNLLGKAILLGGEPHVVIGVLAPGFDTDLNSDVWLPFRMDPNSTDQEANYRAAARLKPGVTLEMAKAQTKLAEAEFRREFPSTAASQASFELETMREVVVGDVRPAIFVLLGAVSFVLLIACANVANLLLARATGRRREMAIRAALGAGRRRIISQLLSESLLLSLAGGALALLLGYTGVRGLLAINPGHIPNIGAQGSAVTLDWRILVFTLLATTFTGILFGLLPALTASRDDFGTALKESGARSGASLGQSKARSILVVTEVALSLVLLAGAALLLRTFMALRAVHPGFDGHNVLTLEMSLAESRFEKTTAVAQLVRDAEQRVESLPGVEALATTSSFPLDPQVFPNPVIIEGRPLGKDQYHGWADLRIVSARYFEVFRIPLRQGRMFTQQDDGRAPGVVTVNEAMARQFWPKGNPVGQRIILFKGFGPQYEEPPRQVIGVVADIRDQFLGKNPEPMMYVPMAQLTDGLTTEQDAFSPMMWAVRTKSDPYSFSADIQRELRIASGGLPVTHIRSMDQVSVESTARSNFNMTLLSIFAGLAMLLAAIGICGVMSYTVGQQVREIGIRMALGARAGNVLSLVLRQGLGMVLVGIALGVIGGVWLTTAMKSLLFGVTPNDAPTFVIVSAILLAVAAAATYIPARRATKVDPIVALRYE
jgi:putative ABC transport system permease protein